jgi:hypothetical protein
MAKGSLLGLFLLHCMSKQTLSLSLSLLHMKKNPTYWGCTLNSQIIIKKERNVTNDACIPFCVCSVQSTSGIAACPDGFIKHHGSCYVFLHHHLSWPESIVSIFI